MDITVRVVIDPGDGGPVTSHDIATLTRGDLTTATAGLHLAEAHQIVSGIQQHLVTAQTTAAVIIPRLPQSELRRSSVAFGVAGIPTTRALVLLPSSCARPRTRPSELAISWLPPSAAAGASMVTSSQPVTPRVNPAASAIAV